MLAAGGVWGTGRGEFHFHVAPGFPLGPGRNNPIAEYRPLYLSWTLSVKHCMS